MSIPTPPPMPKPDSPDYWKELRAQFPMPPDEAYCNTGTIGVSPIRVINAMYQHVLTANTRAAHIDWREGGQVLLSGYAPYVEIRENLGKLINTEYQNIALNQNATMGMNLLANGLEIPKDAPTITTALEHPRSGSAWELQSRRHGSKHRMIKIPRNIDGPAEIVAAFEQAITTDTYLISFPHISSAQG